MELQRTEPTIQIGFFGGEESVQGRQVDVATLVAILGDFQRAVYVTVADRLGLPNTRNLTQEQRRQNALVVTGVEFGSLRILLAPEMIPLYVAVYSAVLQTIELIRGLAEGRREGGSQMEAIVRNVIEASERSGKDIDFLARDPQGIEVQFRITEPVRLHYYETYAAATRYVADVPDEVWEAEYGQPVSFGRGQIRDIMTTQPIITVQFFDSQQITPCEYSQAYSNDFTTFLKTFEVIEVIGWPIGVHAAAASGPSKAIRIAAVEDAEGTPIGNPRYFR